MRDKRVAFVAVLTGPVDAERVSKSSWGIKKQFCGNTMVGGYLCPADDDQTWGPTESEVAKVRAFARRCCEEQTGLTEKPGSAFERGHLSPASVELDLDQFDQALGAY